MNTTTMIGAQPHLEPDITQKKKELGLFERFLGACRVAQIAERRRVTSDDLERAGL